MYESVNIPPDFIPFKKYISETTLAFTSFNIPNTKENYEQFMTLVEPVLHPSIVEIHQVPDPSVNIFIRISTQSLETPEALMRELITQASDILDSENAIKTARDILNNTTEEL